MNAERIYLRATEENFLLVIITNTGAEGCRYLAPGREGFEVFNCLKAMIRKPDDCVIICLFSNRSGTFRTRKVPQILRFRPSHLLFLSKGHLEDDCEISILVFLLVQGLPRRNECTHIWKDGNGEKFFFVGAAWISCQLAEKKEICVVK